MALLPWGHRGVPVTRVGRGGEALGANGLLEIEHQAQVGAGTDPAAQAGDQQIAALGHRQLAGQPRIRDVDDEPVGLVETKDLMVDLVGRVHDQAGLVRSDPQTRPMHMNLLGMDQKRKEEQ